MDSGSVVMKLGYANNYFLLSFRYDPEMIKKVKTFIGATWDKKNRQWKVPASFFHYKVLQDTFSMIEEDANVKQFLRHLESIADTQVDEKFFSSLKTVPYEHQKRAVRFLAGRSCGALLLDMGTGKTKIMIDTIQYRQLQGGWNKILVVCPLSVVSQWVKEIRKHSDLKFWVLDGSPKKKIKTLKEGELGFCIMNYESVLSILKELEDKQFDVIVADESTKIKNQRAKRSKALYSISHTVPYRYVMTGTPISNGIVDWFGQSKFLDPALLGSQFAPFKDRYCVMGGYNDYQIVGYKNIEELQTMMDLVSLRITKAECLDLPDKVYEKRIVKMVPEQAKLYEKVREDIIIEIKEHEFEINSVLARLMKLQEVCGGFLNKTEDVEGKRVVTATIDVGNAKLLEVLDIMDEVGPASCVIWCRFTREIDVLYDELNNAGYKCAKFYGDTKPEDRSLILSDFEAGKIQVFIGQIATGGLGIDLTAAAIAIYFSNTFSYQDRIQSEDRLHRIGQKKSVVYIDLVCDKTVDDRILDILKAKKNIADYIVDKKMGLELFEKIK